MPYVWGGATPGVGFDCSGLTMWAWAQAGVSLPHSAAMQMASTTPVPLSDLQPGDLLFYSDGSGYIGHVTMYVGPGEMIQAEETGTSIMITGIWSNNLASPAARNPGARSFTVLLVDSLAQFGRPSLD